MCFFFALDQVECLSQKRSIKRGRQYEFLFARTFTKHFWWFSFTNSSPSLFSFKIKSGSGRREKSWAHQYDRIWWVKCSCVFLVALMQKNCVCVRKYKVFKWRWNWHISKSAFINTQRSTDSKEKTWCSNFLLLSSLSNKINIVKM